MVEIKDVLDSKSYSKSSIFAISAILLILLFAIALKNYLLFHIIAESFSIIVCMAIYVLASRTYRYSGNSHLLFVGYSFLFHTVILFFHILAYYGMGIFPNLSIDEPTQLWIASKYIQAVGILVSPLFVKRKFSNILVVSTFTTVTLTSVIVIFQTDIFPSCFIMGVGLTDFKIISEYVISFIFLLALIHLYLRRKEINPQVYGLLSISILLIILSEIAYTLYETPYGLQNILGHCFTTISYSLMYFSIVLRCIEHPYSKLMTAYDKTIEGLSKALELRDFETKGHSDRVTKLTVRLAKAYGIEGKALIDIYRGAMLHDIGKIGVPDSILLKKGPLSEEEWVIMRKHTDYSYELLTFIDYLKDSIDIPYYHHEKWDGAGYPCGLKGKEIPVSARIFAIVDVWDALTSDRPYRKAWTTQAVIEHISSLSGTHFDPEIVELFIKTIGQMNPEIPHFPKIVEIPLDHLAEHPSLNVK